MPDGEALGKALPVVPAPAKLEGERAEEQRGVRDAAGQHDVGALRQRLGDRLGAEVSIREQQSFPHAGDVGASVHVGEALAGGAQMVDAPGHRVAGHHRDLCRPSLGAEGLGKCRTRAHRVQAAGIQDELHAVLYRQWPQFDQHRDRVARIARRGIFLAVFLQDREGQLGEVVRAYVADAAALDRGGDRAPRIAVETKASADTDGFHAQPV